MLSLVQVLDHLAGFSSFVGMDRPRWLHTKGMILAQVEPVQNPIILAHTWCQVGLAANASAFLKARISWTFLCVRKASWWFLKVHNFWRLEAQTDLRTEAQNLRRWEV